MLFQNAGVGRVRTSLTRSIAHVHTGTTGSGIWISSGDVEMATSLQSPCLTGPIEQGSSWSLPREAR
jgi:hypothetical protein